MLDPICGMSKIGRNICLLKLVKPTFKKLNITYIKSPWLDSAAYGVNMKENFMTKAHAMLKIYYALLRAIYSIDGWEPWSSGNGWRLMYEWSWVQILEADYHIWLPWLQHLVKTWFGSNMTDNVRDGYLFNLFAVKLMFDVLRKTKINKKTSEWQIEN